MEEKWVRSGRALRKALATKHPQLEESRSLTATALESSLFEYFGDPMITEVGYWGGYGEWALVGFDLTEAMVENAKAQLEVEFVVNMITYA
ncbi:hypothetical protein DVH24_016568 [Malus domestica]|uniref:Uncharacterized protein n=1 Tax=Malus domestica TaxID=3750 RepID=A0A498HQJ7_MALDO|nr:hypothetical protein DVH24_016568 [Malus domestica]